MKHWPALLIALLGVAMTSGGTNKMNYGATVQAFGDSFSLYDSTLTHFHQYVATILGAADANHALSGSGLCRAVFNGYTYLPPGSGKYNITLQAGANDLYRTGATTQTLAKMGDCTKAFLANAFLATAVPASAVTSVGATIGSAGPLGVWGEKAQSLGGAARFSYVNGEYFQWTFSGDSLVIGSFASNGASYALGDIKVWIDGVLKETVNFAGKTDGNSPGLPADYKEGLTPVALVYTGLGAGSHTVKVEKAGGTYMLLDYFGTLASPSNSPSVLVGEVHALNSAGYAAQLLRSPYVDSLGTAVIAAQVSYFEALGYPVVMVPINSFYDLTTGVGPDNEHPNALGQAQIAMGYLAQAKL